MYKKVLKTTPSLFLRTLSRTVTPFLFFSLGKKKVGAIRLKSQKSERKSPFWVGGYPPFSALTKAIFLRSCLTSSLRMEYSW